MDDLIEQHMGLVVSVVNSFKPTSAERDDYIQAGRIGLWKALQKYNPDKGAAISTYAWNPIRWEIIKEIKYLKKYSHPSLSLAWVSTDSYIKEDSIWEYMPDSLDDKELKILDLRRRGHTLAEICESMDKGRSFVKRNLCSAAQKIRDSHPHE